jgi:tetratricopeptide (TPR) repeat protein
MLSAEERYRLLEEASELSGRWEFESVVKLLDRVEAQDLWAEPELGCYLANALVHTSHPNRAYELVQSLAASCAVRGRDSVYCRRLLIKASVEVSRGDLDGGTLAYLEVLALATSANAQRLVAAATMNLATIAALKCEYATALSSYARAVVAYEELNDTYRLAGCHHNLAMVCKELGLLKESAQHFDLSRALFIQTGHDKELIFNDFERALLMHLRGETIAAEIVAQKAYERAVESELVEETGEALRVLGIIHRDRGDYGKAEQEFQAARAAAEESRAKLLHAEVLEECAVLFGEMGKVESAERCAEMAVALYNEMGSTTRAAKVESRMSVAFSRSASLG